MLGCLYLLLFTWTSDSPDARMFPIANHARPRSLSSCTRRILSSSNQFPRLWLLRQLIMMMVMMMMTTFKTPSSSSSVFLFSSIIQSFTAVREESSFGCSFVSFFWPSTVWNYWASDDHHDYLIVSVWAPVLSSRQPESAPRSVRWTEAKSSADSETQLVTAFLALA